MRFSDYRFSFIKMKYYFLFFVILVLFFIYELEAGKICYKAKICIHSGVERCGINSKGELRRFIDSCDMLEYNCLKSTDYLKTSLSRCSGLPPLENSKETANKNEKDSVGEILNKKIQAGNIDDKSNVGANEKLDKTKKHVEAAALNSREDMEITDSHSLEKKENLKAVTKENGVEFENNSEENNEKSNVNVDDLDAQEEAAVASTEEKN